jgi:hypothetical protein
MSSKAAPTKQATAPEATPRAAPWRGRRRVADPKGKFIAVRCTDGEHASLTAAAAQAGLSVGAYLRRAALGDAGPRARRQPNIVHRELARALGLLGHHGSNLNQLARIANTTGMLPAELALDELAAQVRAIRDAVMQALGRETSGSEA